MNNTLIPTTASVRPRGPRPAPHPRSLARQALLARLSDDSEADSSRQSLLRFLGLSPNSHSSEPDSTQTVPTRMQRASSPAWSAQSWKLRYTDNASFELDSDVQSRVHMDREGGERRVLFVVADGDEGSRGASEEIVNGQPREAGSIQQDANAVNSVSGEAMAVDTASAPTAVIDQDETMSVSSHSSMPELVPMSASSFGQGGADDDFLDLFDLYMDDTNEREPVTAEEIYASRLFADDEILLDPVEEAHIQAVWAEVDRIRMPIPSVEGSTESSWNSDDELKEIADHARQRREFPNFHIPDLPSNMYPPSDSDDTDLEDQSESGLDVDDMIARVTGLRNVDEYDELQRGFQDELAARDMASGSNTWYTPLPLASPGTALTANDDGETLFDLQSFLNLESPGMELTDTGRG